MRIFKKYISVATLSFKKSRRKRRREEEGAREGGRRGGERKRGRGERQRC